MIHWIHGLGEHPPSFRPIASRLGAHVMIELPGYAGTAHTCDTLDALADWLAARVDDDAILAGHSMGGVLATLVAERRRVRAIVNLDGNLTRGDCTFSARAATQSLDRFLAGGFDEMRRDVEASAEPALRGYALALARANPLAFHAHAVDLVRLSETETLCPRLAALKIPVLFIAGVPGGICAASKAALDRARVRWLGLAPAGHWVFIDREAECVEVIASFVASI